MRELKIAILISAIAVVCLAGSTTAFAATPVTTEQEPMKDQEKVEITMVELPAAAQEDIKENHTDAKFVSAYKMVDEEGNVKYKVLLNNGGKELKLWFDDEGSSTK